MSEGRKKLSGSEYRKRAKEKNEKAKEEIKGIRTLDTFFGFDSSKKIVDVEKSLEHPNIHTLLSSNGKDVDDQHAGSFVAITATSSNVDLSEEAVDQTQQMISAATTSSSENGNIAESLLAEKLEFSHDPAKWNINDSTVDHIAMFGVNKNKDADFSNSKRVYDDQIRFLPKSLFERRLLNGEMSSRSWLIYSESTGHVYCGPCIAFGGGTQFGTIKEGFNDWKNAVMRVAQHENSPSHKLNVLSLKARGSALGRIDKRLTEQLSREISYWKSVLKRVVATVKALASRGMSFRGDDEKFGSSHNGNYLMSLELIAEFDPFLADHISRYGNPGSGHTSYLSSTICEEFIGLMANKLTNQIVSEIISAKYFSIIVDSTPDISHVDQLTFVIRFVQDNGSPIERFLKFIPNVGHKAQEIADAVISTLEDLKIDISNCRGQSYDNAANMSGIYNGLQAKIKMLSPLANYVPCAAHSLNLVGESAAESTEEACWFFALMQELYTFFTASTHRWNLLQSSQYHVNVKSLSATRWSARTDACRSLYHSWEQVLGTLLAIEADQEQKPTVRCEAKGIRVKLERLETAFMTVFWNFILNRINLVNKKLQSVDIDIFTVAELYDSLIILLSETRDQFNEFEEKAKFISKIIEYENDMKRKKKRKLLPGETAGEVDMPGRDHMRVMTFFVIIDSLLCELRKRRDAYRKFHEQFSFLTSLAEMTSDDVKNKATALQNIYSSDFEENFVDECLHFRAHCSATSIKWKTSLKLLEWMRERDIQTVYPNVHIALRICASTPVTNCSGERSFSWLRRAKNYLRSKMVEERLNSLAILNIESDLLKTLDYDDLIQSFAVGKSKRVVIH